MRITKMVNFLFLTAALSVTNVYADKIMLVADQWIPYTGPVDRPGYMTEIAIAALKLKGHEAQYLVRPYARALKEVEGGSKQALIGIYGPDAKDKGFYIEEDFPLGLSQNKFYVKKGSDWNYNGDYKSLKGKKVGLIADYSYNEVSEHKNDKLYIVDEVGGDDPLAQNLRKLVGGRIDITIDDELVVEATAKELGADISGNIREAGKLGAPNKVYIAFAPLKANPKSAQYAKDLKDGVEQLRKSGEFKKILDKYSVKDWK